MLPGPGLKGRAPSGIPMESGQTFFRDPSRASTMGGVSYVNHQRSVGKKDTVPVGWCLVCHVWWACAPVRTRVPNALLLSLRGLG